MAVLNQNITVFEDDTVDLEFEVSTPNESDAYYGVSILGAILPNDGFWWGVSTEPGSTPIGPSNSIILEKSSGWFTGVGLNASSLNITTAITQNTTNASPTNTSYLEYSGWTTSGNGEGLLLDIYVNTSGVVNQVSISSPLPSSISANGQNFEIEDTVTIPTSLIGGTTDVILEFDRRHVLQPYYPSNKGGLTVDSANIYDGIFPYTNQTYNPAIVTVSLTQADYQALSGPLVTNKTYYWQLVWGRRWQGMYPTQVVATGTLKIEPSQFSTTGYRP